MGKVEHPSRSPRLVVRGVIAPMDVGSGTGGRAALMTMPPTVQLWSAGMHRADPNVLMYANLSGIEDEKVDTPVRHAELRDSVWISRGFTSAGTVPSCTSKRLL